MNKITLILLLFCVTIANAQSSWKKIDSENYKAKTELEFRKTIPTTFDLYSLDTDTFKSEIETSETINIPINGELAEFYINESSPFTNPIASEYGYIKSFSLKGIDDKTATGKISIGVNGVYIIIFSGKHSTVYIDPYTKNKSNYITYQKKDLENSTDDFSCLVDDELISKKTISDISKKTSTDGVLRTYRLALACTTEYSDYHLNNQGISNIETDAVKKAAILSAMNTTITRVNGIFEKDLGVTMNIVINSEGENELIFIDSDDLSNNDAGNLIDESQEICDAIIGTNNYDIGHTFSTGAGGLAGLGVVCTNGQKASGVTGSSSPIGDSFDIDYVAHELGHQFGANHTFNNSCDSNRSNSTAVEPGSGSTIMSYAGICTPNIQNSSNDYFHAISINQMWDTIESTSCATETSTNNSAPNVNTEDDVSVPKSTPLILRGEATDEDNDSLTYTWEQTDTEIATMPPLSTNIAGPAFRSLYPSTSPDRYLPVLSTVIAGSTESEWEVIPSVAREMNFSLLVRDNNTNAGATGRDDITISVIDTDPFIVTSQDSAVTWEVATTETITWEVGTTNEAPINCENVKITLSTDGGETFPITLVESTPNNGSYDIVVPNQLTSNARVMIEAIDNIFYNVNTTNFSIVSSGPIFTLSNISETQETCNTASTSINYDINISFINDFSETVNLSIEDLPTGITAEFSSTVITETDQVTLSLSNLENLTTGDYIITIKGESTSLNSTLELPTLSVYSTLFDEVSLTSPSNNSNDIEIQDIEFSWSNTDSNTSSFDLEIATDSAFNNITISEENLTNNTLTLDQVLNTSTTYYWRVKPKNNCGEGNFSDVYNFTTSDESYCSSNFTLTDEYITNVTFNTINNDSGDANDNNETGNNGYQDFTDISTNLITGYTYTLSVTLNTVGFRDHCYVFIDWNNDAVFDTTTERYDLGSHSGDGELTGSEDIIIPDDASLGYTRMRVIIEYFDNETTYGDGACNSDHNSEYGETEDYTLLITNSVLSDTDNVFTNFSLGPNPTEGVIQLSFEVQNTDEDVSLLLSDMTGSTIKKYNYENTSIFFNKQINLSSIQTGMYLLNIINGNKQTTKKIIIR